MPQESSARPHNVETKGDGFMSEDVSCRRKNHASPDHDQREAAMKLPKNLGMLLLAIWLILFAVLTAPSLRLTFAYSGDVLAVFAVIVAVLLLVQR
jgi:hypothetical protein